MKRFEVHEVECNREQARQALEDKLNDLAGVISILPVDWGFLIVVDLTRCELISPSYKGL